MLTKKQRMFLKERGLLKSFRRYEKIKRPEKVRVYRDGEKQDYLIYRKNNKTVVARAYDVKKVYSSRKDKKEVISLLGKKKETTAHIKEASWKDKQGNDIYYSSKEIKTKSPSILLDVVRTERFNNFYREHSDRARRRRGTIFLNITFFNAKKTKKQTVEADSGEDHNLRTDKSLAWQQAFRRCAAQVNFSWDDYTVNYEHYVYNYRYKDGEMR